MRNIHVYIAHVRYKSHEHGSHAQVRPAPSILYSVSLSHMLFVEWNGIHGCT